jgi:hypothetical protein
MNKPSPTEDLAALHDLLSRLETGELTLRRGYEDISKQEIGLLKAAITRLETILERMGSEQKSDEPINYSGRTRRFSRSDK